MSPRDGKPDVVALAKEFTVSGREVVLTAGMFNGSVGFTATDNHCQRPTMGETVRDADHALTQPAAERKPCR